MDKPGKPDGTTREPALRVSLDVTPLLGARTGVGVFVARALEGLAALAPSRRMQISAFAVTWRGRRQVASELPPGVEHVRALMPARPLHTLWGSAGLPPIELFAGEVDVVHGTNYVVPPSRRAARVVAVHDLSFVKFPHLCDPATLVFRKLVARALAEGALAHVPSRYVAGELAEEYGAEAEQVRVIPYGAPSTHGQLGAHGAKERIRHLLPAGAESYVLALGRVDPRKDLVSLVEAFDQVASRWPDLALVVAGPDGIGTDSLREATARAAHRERIVRLGYVDDDLKASLISGASVFAYPSIYEGFGFPPLEAMAAGTPVVATTVGALMEVLGNAALLVPPGDPGALAGAVESLLSDPSLAEQMRTRGLERAACYSWEASASALADLYEEAARSHAGRASFRRGRLHAASEPRSRDRKRTPGGRR
jgi:glycosyltransferase involved in cell wall biosynthesis